MHPVPDLGPWETVCDPRVQVFEMRRPPLDGLRACPLGALLFRDHLPPLPLIVRGYRGIHRNGTVGLGPVFKGC